MSSLTAKARVVTADLDPVATANSELPVTMTPEGRLRVDASLSVADVELNIAKPTTGTITSVNDTDSDTTILAANTSRKGAAVFNDSTVVLYLALASTTSSATNYTVQIPAGGYFELPVSPGGVYTGVLKGIWASNASGAARITEWT